MMLHDTWHAVTWSSSRVAITIGYAKAKLQLQADVSSAFTATPLDSCAGSLSPSVDSRYRHSIGTDYILSGRGLSLSHHNGEIIKRNAEWPGSNMHEDTFDGLQFHILGKWWFGFGWFLGSVRWRPGHGHVWGRGPGWVAPRAGGRARRRPDSRHGQNRWRTATE